MSEELAAVDGLAMQYVPRNGITALEIAKIIVERIREQQIVEQILNPLHLDQPEQQLAGQAFAPEQQETVLQFVAQTVAEIQELLVSGEVALIGSVLDDMPDAYLRRGEIYVEVEGLDIDIVVPIKLVNQVSLDGKYFTILLRAFKKIVHQMTAIGAERRKNIARMLHPFMEKLFYYMRA